MDVIAEIVIEILTIFAIVTKEVKCGQFRELMSHIFRKVFEV